MALFTPPEDLLIRAMLAKQLQVRLNHCIGPLDLVFKSALKKERRLLAFLSSDEASYMKTGIVQLCYDYDVTIQYRDSCPESVDDVVLDNGDWDASTILKKGAPQDIVLVTNDVPGTTRKMSEILEQLTNSYEGLHGWRTNSFSFEKISSDSVCTITYAYIVPLQQLRQFQGKAIFEAKNIWKRILGKANVPQFVKPFLAFSYLTQECCYDQRAFDEAESDKNVLPSDPIPHLAYGPLVEKRGICSGFAWAFKTLMDEANVECVCISGYLKDCPGIGHMWNLVKLDGQFYHVDPTWGAKNDGVFIECLMQPDSIMKVTHLWNAENYPEARGMRLDYDYIENYLAENGNDFLDDGANETYFFPEKIID